MADAARHAGRRRRVPRRALLHHGFSVPTDSKRRALTACKTAGRPSWCASWIASGWHDAKGGRKVYVLPRETLGDDGGRKRVMFRARRRPMARLRSAARSSNGASASATVRPAIHALLFAASCAQLRGRCSPGRPTQTGAACILWATREIGQNDRAARGRFGLGRATTQQLAGSDNGL